MNDFLKVALFKNDSTAGIQPIPRTMNPSGVLLVQLQVYVLRGFNKGSYKFAGFTKNGFLKYKEIV